MQTIELNKMGVQEMNTNEQQVIEGGFWDIIFPAAAALIAIGMTIYEWSKKNNQSCNTPGSGGGGGSTIRYALN